MSDRVLAATLLLCGASMTFAGMLLVARGIVWLIEGDDPADVTPPLDRIEMPDERRRP